MTFTGSVILACLAAVTFASDPAVPLPYSNTYETRDIAVDSSDSQTAASGPYFQHYGNPHEGYKIQSGFESYVPALAYGLTHAKPSIIHLALAKVKPILVAALAILPKAAVVLVTILGLIAVGTLLTSCLCAFTPICHMSFLGYDLTQESVRGLIKEDTLTRVTRFLKDSVKKFEDMNAAAEAKIEETTNSISSR